jgi:heme-degrading monooxygenase HmoA
MTVVKINALEIPPQAGEEIVKRFAARMETLNEVPGFEGFELLRPTSDTEPRWFVYTRWADQVSYEGWRDGRGAQASHAEEAGRAAGPPVSMGATLLEFEVALEKGPSGR